MPVMNAVWAAEQARLRRERLAEIDVLVGRLVRLTHDIVASDGDGVRRGHLLRVAGYSQGRWMLADPGSGVLVVSGAVRPSFELVESAA